MDTINIKEFEESFVIHFGGDFTRINAYTLASSLVSLANAVKVANSVINPGYEVEVVVEALGAGSFKAKVRTLYRGAGNLFSKQNLKAVVLGVISTYVAQVVLPQSGQVNVTVNTDEVIIEQGGKRIVVPRIVHDELEKVRKIEKFQENISQIFESVERDESIKSLGFSKNMDDENPVIKVPRDCFPLVMSPVSEQENSHQLIEIADLTIKRAILERSKRRWEFVWRGMKISAPVLDDKFYNDFFARKITIAPGDSLSVKLKIYQVRDSDTGIFTNEKYEIIEVLEHVPRAVQMAFNMELSDSNAVLRKLRLDD